jgi:hypothetical protein
MELLNAQKLSKNKKRGNCQKGTNRGRFGPLQVLLNSLLLESFYFFGVFFVFVYIVAIFEMPLALSGTEFFQTLFSKYNQVYCKPGINKNCIAIVGRKYNSVLGPRT